MVCTYPPELFALSRKRSYGSILNQVLTRLLSLLRLDYRLLEMSTESFFMLTPHVRDKLLSANLTAAQWRIWCYLVSLDPFGDRFLILF